MERQRCAWCGSDPLYVAYHDQEWGVPLHDDVKLFEFLALDGAERLGMGKLVLDIKDGMA